MPQIKLISYNIELLPSFLMFLIKEVNSRLKFALDFLFIILPIILSLTLFSDHISVILLLQLVALLSLITFSLCEYCFIAREKPTLREIFSQMVDDQHSPTKFITYMRLLLLFACISTISENIPSLKCWTH